MLEVKVKIFAGNLKFNYWWLDLHIVGSSLKTLAPKNPNVFLPASDFTFGNNKQWSFQIKCANENTWYYESNHIFTFMKLPGEKSSEFYLLSSTNTLLDFLKISQIKSSDLFIGGR